MTLPDLSKKSKEEIITLCRKLDFQNAELDRKLSMAAMWMRREVENSMLEVAKRRLAGMARQARESFVQDNQPDIIAQRIRDYFGDLLLLNAPGKTVEHLVDAEIAWYHLQKNPATDGLAVVASFQKILDLLSEQCLTRDFRKFAKKRGAVVLRVNDPLEKALYRVIQENHILSAGRIYGLLAAVAEGKPLPPLGEAFREFLGKRTELAAAFLDPEFLRRFRRLAESEVLGSKRHEGKISLEETKEARQLLAGGFEDQGGILYRMLASQAVLI